PTDVSSRPCQAALAETSISGAEDPIATIVRPIIIGEIPAVRATDDAPNTKRSALQISKIRPTNTKITANNKGDKIFSPNALSNQRLFSSLLTVIAKKAAVYLT
ncbi:MAG: hypothetical protein ACI8U1_000682, partial [Rheinheimera aquimaris]